MTNLEVLKTFFGFNSFKDIQQPVIDNLLQGRNTLCLMPTGGGKSIIYQVAGLQTKKMTIVISPLLALMKQQNKRLEDQGISSFAYNSSIGESKTQFNKLRKLFSEPELPRFLFVSPEKILSDGYLEFLLRKHRSKIGLIVIDEAHCISQWGHTFRPAYKTIPYFIENVFGSQNVPPVLCLTATLNKHDKSDICSDLRIANQDIFISSQLLRSNLKLSIRAQVESNEEKKQQLLDILALHKNEKVIVYTHIKAREYGTREMAKAFTEKGFNCHYFDADMKDSEKLEVLEKFERGDVKIVFATSAFGMGIDIPDIRVVVHYLVPESIEQYYQEVGRAGRDGRQAYGYLLFSDTNVKVRRDLIKRSLLKPDRIKEIFTETIMPSAKANSLLKRRKTEDTVDTGDKIYALSRTDMREDNSEMVIFLFLVNAGIVRLRGKGVQFFDCFEPVVNTKLYELMKEASLNGMMNRIAKQLNKSIEQTNLDVFTMFNQGELNLSKVPFNVLNYTVTAELTDELADQIHSVLKELTASRLLNFEKLIEAISSDTDPIAIIAGHLGIDRIKEFV